MDEFGIFTDEGLVEGGFYSEAEADAYADTWYRHEDVFIDRICPDHPEQSKNTCEECNEDE